jgi:hypothetical protein
LFQDSLELTKSGCVREQTQKPILAVAVRHASVDVIKYLVAKGISLNETDKVIEGERWILMV